MFFDLSWSNHINNSNFCKLKTLGVGVMFNLSLLLNSDIMPEVSGAWASFFSGIGSFFVWLGSAILKGLASIAYVICKLVMGLIDFLQFLVQKLAGIEVYMNMEKFDPESLKQSDIVFRFLFSDAVSKVLKSVMVVFIVLLIVFTIFAIIKNEYKAATTGGGDSLDHRKSWYAAFRAVITVILVPVLLVMGIMGSNAILASIARTYNISGNMSLGGQIFVASSYDASLYRNYANNGVRKYTSNQVSFTYDGKTYTVNSAIEVITPNSYSNTKPFTGYMFTYDGSTYYLCKCDATDEEETGKTYYNVAYYYYLKYVLGAYIVEKEPEHNSDIVDYFKDKGYNTTNIPTDNAAIIDNVKEVYQDFVSNWAWDKLLSFANNILSFGLIQKDQAYLCKYGFMIHELYEENGGSMLIDAAYNTWSYNSILATDLSSWDSQNVSLETSTNTFYTLAGRSRVATVVKNSSSWGKLHDGGVDGFHPLSVEYLAMADVMDFVLENGIALYYVNANNSNINYEQSGITTEYRYKDGEVDATRKTAGFDGFLVDYKDIGRVAYAVKDDVVSELDGATYIVCYYDSDSNQYIPVVNGEKVKDSYGNTYEFKSSQYSGDYKGVVIARGMFKDSSQARATEPTYLTSAMVIGNKKTDFDSKVATAVKLDLLSDSGITYNYLKQLTTADSSNIDYYNTLTPAEYTNTEGTWSYQNEKYYWNGTNLIYCVNPEYTKTTTIDETTTTEQKTFSGTDFNAIYERMREILVDEICISDDGVGVKSFEMVDGSLVTSLDECTFKIKRVGAGESDQIYSVTMKINRQDITTKVKNTDDTTTDIKAYQYTVTPTIEGTGEKVVWSNLHKGFTHSTSAAGTNIAYSDTLYMYSEGTILYFSNDENFSTTNYELLAQIVETTLSLWADNISLAPVDYSSSVINNKDVKDKNGYIYKLKEDIEKNISDNKYSIVISSRTRESGDNGSYTLKDYNGEKKYTLTFNFEKAENNTISSNAKYPEKVSVGLNNIELLRRAIFGLDIEPASDTIDDIKWKNTEANDTKGKYQVAFAIDGTTGDGSTTNGKTTEGVTVYIYSNVDTKVYNSANIFNKVNKENGAIAINKTIKAFSAPEGYKYQFVVLSIGDSSIKINFKDELEASDLPDSEDGWIDSIYVALVKDSNENAKSTSDISLVKRIYNLKFNFTAGALGDYQTIVSSEDNQYHYWKDAKGENTELACQAIFTFGISPNSDNPMFSQLHKVVELETKTFYHQVNYQTLKDEFFYYDDQNSMDSKNLSATAENIAKSFVDNVLKVSGTSVEYVESSANYSGNVEFAYNETGSLVVTFTVKVSLENENYYLIDYSLTMTSHECINPLSSETNKNYQYKFDVNYNIYNTYNIYTNDKALQAYNGSGTGDFVMTVKDLSYSGTDEYLFTEYADSSKNVATTVYQYKYSTLGSTNSNAYTFNAITGKDSKVDDGKKFITGEVIINDETTTFVPDFGIDSSGKLVDGDKASVSEKDNARKLVFVTAKMRIIYMPDFSAIYDSSKFNSQKDESTAVQALAETDETTSTETYTFVIVDTQNHNINSATYYTLTFTKNAESIKWEKDTIKAYTTTGGAATDITNETILSTAKEYIKSRFKMEIVNVDLHNYLDATKKEVDGQNLYKTTIMTDTGRSISYSSTNAFDGLTGDESKEAFSSSVMQQRLIDKAKNFNDKARVITIDYLEYNKAYDIADIAQDMLKVISNPISVLCCRDDVTTRQLVADFHINMLSDTAGFKFTFRMPRFAFATKQKSSGDNIILSLSKGQFSMDYNFEGKIALGNLYSVVDINYIILVFAVALIFGILGKAVWGLVGRIYQITLLYLMMPVIASTLPIDEKGTRFDSWKNQMITEVMSTYGVTIGLNFFFIMVPVIRESTQIFTDADFVNMSSTMKWFAGSPERLNYICYILFMLVAFTLLKTVPKMVQEFTGYKKDVVDSGGALKTEAMKTVQEASKTASNFVTGKTLVDGVKNTGEKAKEMATGMIPGKAIYDEYKKRKEAKEGESKKAAEAAAEAKKKENQKLAMEHAHETADAAKAKMEEAKAKQAQAQDGSATDSAEAQNVTPQTNATPGSSAAYADVAGALDEKAKQAIVDEAVEKTSLYTDAAVGMAEAAMEAADAQFGKTHDYVADKEKEEAELKAAEKAQQDYDNSRAGKAWAAYNEANESGKGYDILFKKDILEWNKTHKDEQISMEKLVREQNETDAEFKARQQKDLENRLKASHQKHVDRLYARAKDEDEGIKHGVGHSIVRTVVGGRKTMWQRGKEARDLQLLEEEKNKLTGQKLTTYKKDKKINEFLDKNFNISNLQSVDGQNGANDMYKNILNYAKKNGFDKKANEIYLEAMKGLDPNKLDNKQRALEAMKQSIRDQSQEKKNDVNEKLEHKNEDIDKMRDKLTQDRKGWVYKWGSAINTKVIQPGLSKAKVPAKWLADKGHTFVAGHTEQDKESARKFLKLDEIASLTKKINTADNSLNRMKKKHQDQTDLLKIMNDFDKAKNKKDKQQLLDDNKALLKKMGYRGKTLKDFEDYKDVSKSSVLKDRAELSTKITNKYREKSNYVSKLNQINAALSDPRVQKSVKKAQQMLNGTHVRSVGVPVAFAKGTAKLGKWAGQGVWTATKWAGKQAAGVGKAVADTVVDVAKTINNNPTVQKAKQTVKNEIDNAKLEAKILAGKVKASPEYKAVKKVAKGTANVGKVVGKGIWTGVKAVASVPVGAVRGVYNTGKKVVAWHNRVKSSFAGAEAYARANKDGSRAATEAKYKSVQDLIGKTLQKKEKEQIKDIEKRLQNRINRLKGTDESKLLTRANTLKVAEMERLLKGFKAGTLTDAEKKQIDKYLNFSAARTKAKLEETQKRMSRHQATTLSRANQERLIKDLDKKTRAQYQNILQKELTKMGLTPAQISAMIGKYANATAKDYYKGMRSDVNRLLAQKQNDMRKAMANGQQNAKLLTEIRQLNALVSKMQTTDARYRRDLIKLQESNRKIGKQLKNKKSADALSASIKSQMTNPYTNNGGNGGNNGRP